MYDNMLIAVDLDGTLCEGEFWGEGEEPIPKLDNIAIVEELYKLKHHIIIYTARHHSLRAKTEDWLRKYNVRHHALVMGEKKLAADLYIDDKAVNANKFFEVMNNDKRS